MSQTEKPKTAAPTCETCAMCEPQPSVGIVELSPRRGLCRRDPEPVPVIRRLHTCASHPEFPAWLAAQRPAQDAQPEDAIARDRDGWRTEAEKWRADAARVAAERDRYKAALEGIRDLLLLKGCCATDDAILYAVKHVGPSIGTPEPTDRRCSHDES